MPNRAVDGKKETFAGCKQENVCMSYLHQKREKASILQYDITTTNKTRHFVLLRCVSLFIITT